MSGRVELKGRAGGAGAAPTKTGTGLARMIGFLSFFDRFATAPLLVLVAADLHIDVAVAVQLVTVYALTYAIGQPIWGVLSDRLGRTVVLRFALAGAVFGSVGSILAPTVGWLLITRAVTGLFVGALFPTVLTMLGDRFSGPARSQRISDLQTFTALGTTAATLLAGAVGTVFGWRALFVMTGAAALVLLVLAVRLHETPRDPDASRSVRPSLSGWPLLLYGLGILEGAALLGILTYIVPALEHIGLSTALAGLLGAAYGVGVIAGSFAAKRLAQRLQRITVAVAGGIILTLAYALCAVDPVPAGLTVAAVMVGLASSSLHATLQGVATELTPTSRATTVSLFVCSVFLGSAIATGVTAPLVGAGYADVFAVGTVLAMLTTIGTGAFMLTRQRRQR